MASIGVVYVYLLYILLKNILEAYGFISIWVKKLIWKFNPQFFFNM